MGYWKKRSQEEEFRIGILKQYAPQALEECEHKRRAYRYGDKTYPQWVCRDCPYEYDGVEHKPMTLKEIEDGIDVLFGPERSYQ